MSGQPRPPNKRGPPPNYNGRPSSSNPRYQPAPSSDYPTPSYPTTPEPNHPSTDDPPPDKLASVNARVNDVKSSLQKNIELAITRGERIDEMAEKSEQLAEDASTFQASARKVRQKFWARYWKMIALIVILAAVLIIIVVVSVSKGSGS